MRPTHPIRPAGALALATLVALSSCAGSSPAPADSCAVLFGRPAAQTGLTDAQCRPQCACGGAVFTSPTYDAAFVQALVDRWAPETPVPPLAGDPYPLALPAEDPPGTVCGVLPTGPAGSVPRAYRLVTYPSEAASRAAGASPTHFGHCGVCSTLANLAVYMRENDLTAPVRSCGLTSATFDENVACLEGLGFELPCAQIWAYNTANTRANCLGVCLSALNQPYHLPDGSLNACIRCDEEKSGAVFKMVAGRTRRNSGLPNALCRPCSEVQPLVHAY
jgi:hypothetical protein